MENKRRFLSFLFMLISCLLAISSLLQGQVTVTLPASEDVVRSCSDYAEQVLLDSWDMNERTDLGWRIYNTLEEPHSCLGNISFAGGIFSALSQPSGSPDPDYSDANIFILDSAYAGSAKLGKVGRNFPIDADRYTHLVLRMSLEPDAYGPTGQLLWSKDTIYSGTTTSGSFFVYNGWNFYIIDIPSLGIAAGSDPWNGLIDSLRLDPVIKKDKTIKVDWIRLVEPDPSTERTITWSGNSGNVDIYLDDNDNPADGNLGLLARNKSGTSYAFLAGALAPGDYYAAVAPAGTTAFSYSPGYFRVNAAPVLRITRPSEEGSDRDFISVSFDDPWDMDNTEDVEHTERVENDQFALIDYEDLAGRQNFSQSVYYGESTSATPPAVGDPNVFFLHFLYRGGSCTIDTNRYHNLVFKMGVSGPQSVSDGSVARVMWKRSDETVENVTEDIVIRHLDGRWVMNKIVLDLKSIPLEVGSGSPSHSGWTGYVDSFRIDPHEFSSSRAFFFDEVRITSDWTADDTFEIEWELADADGSAYVSFYYDTDNTGFNGTLIASNLLCSPGTGSYSWDTSSVPEGEYWIYAVVDDGLNQNRCYSGGLVIVDHALIPEISLSEKRIYLGAERNGTATTSEKILVCNNGQGTLNWQAVANQGWIEINPASGSGDGILEIGVETTALPAGSYAGTVTVTDPDAWNSPQVVEVLLTVYASGGDNPPFGVFETPPEGATISGNIPVTGWVLDDIEATRVEIRRNPTASDSPEVVDADGLVYIGDAVFVRGARPDVEAAYPTYPRADRAGWGYMMLTNFLPGDGNGIFSLYAIAYDGSGNRVELGTKTITCDNANRTKPFGTIDTPAQGGIVSGSAYVNFGWALTPQPKYIPGDGSTIWVWVDGVPLGHPDYGYYREDIAGLFPGYANSDGAVGFFYIDTTKYANGVHTIAWSVRDSNGDEDGIGSRNFEIQNLGGALAGMTSVDVNSLQVDTAGRLALRVRGMEKGLRGREIESQEERRMSMMNESREEMLKEVRKRADGAYEVEIEELERIELHFRGEGGNKLIGWGKDPSRPLPVGSTLDEREGIFYWHACAGFLGEHVLHFAVTDGTLRSLPVRVVVSIKPKKYGKIQ
jgi:hypothetical protein